MPKPDEQLQEKPQQIKSPYVAFKQDEKQKLRGDSLMDTYAHDQEKMRSYYKTAEKRGETPEQVKSSSKFKKCFKALGRFLTGMPNYGDLYENTKAQWEGFNLDEVSLKLKEKSDQILYGNLPEEDLQEPQLENKKQNEKKKIPVGNIYEAFSSMSKAGHFFQPAQEQNLLNYEEDDASKLTTMRQDLTLQIENLKNKAKEGIDDRAAKKKKKGQKEPSLPELEKKLKDVQDTMYAQERLKVLQKQLSYFKEGNGSLSPQHILDLKDKFFFKGSVGSYIFKLVTGMSATPEAFQYASVNHPQILQMIYYTQILNQMDLAINKLALFKDNEGGNLGQLNLKEYAFLQAQRKETNRLLTELSTNPDLRKSFEEKFPEAFKKTSLKAEQKGAKADKALENGAEEAKEQENKLAVNQKFLKLYKEYTELSEKDKEQFLFKNLKNILNNAVEICKNQPKEEVKKDDPQFASIESNIKSNVEKIAEDPYAYDHFMAQKNSAGLDILMEAIAYMVPESSISQKNIGGNLSEELANYYWHTYSKDKKESTAASISALENPASMLLENEYTQDTLHVLTESYQGFHNKSLEKFNNLYSVVRKIACDPKAFDALEKASKTSPEKKQFDLMNLLINFDHALYTLENQKLQKDTYYKTVNDISQELATYLPTLGGWYKNYSKDPAKEDKGEATKALSEQINALKEKSNKASEIDDKNSQKFIGALKEFIKKVPVNAEDENADIYKSISEALTSPYIAAVIKQPEYLKTILSLADIILAKDKEASNIKPEKLAIISASFSVIIKALQTEQKREEIKKESIKTLTEEKNDVIKNEKIIEKINNQVELLQKKYFSKEKNQEISDADAEKLVQSLQAFYNAFPVTKESRNASHVNNALKDPNLLVVLKNPQILTSFLNLADLIAKNQPLTFDDKIGVSFKDIEKALKTLKAPEQQQNAEQKSEYIPDEQKVLEQEAPKQEPNIEPIKVNQSEESEASKEPELHLENESREGNVLEKQQVPEQHLNTEEGNEISKTEDAKEFQTGTLNFYPTDKFKEPPITASPVEDQLAREKQSQIDEENQRIVNQQFSDQIDKVLKEHPIIKRQSSLQSLDLVEEVPAQKTIKIQTKKTGFITTFATWFARLFRRKTAKAAVDDTNDLKIKMNDIGPLEEITDEEDLINEEGTRPTVKQIEEPIKEQEEEPIIESFEESIIEPVEKNINPEIKANAEVENNNRINEIHKDEDLDEVLKKLDQELINEEFESVKDLDQDPNIKEEENATEEPTVESFFKNYTPSEAKATDVIAEVEKLQGEIKQEEKVSKITKELNGKANAEYQGLKEANKKTSNESKTKNSCQQSNQKKVPITLTKNKLPLTFQEMENKAYIVTHKMEEEFIAAQKTFIRRSKFKEVTNNVKHMPEYYVNFQQLYTEVTQHPENVLLIKLVNLLKCNDPEILLKERKNLYNRYYHDNNNPLIDPLLLKHLKDRAYLLFALNTLDKKYAKQKQEPCSIKGNYFDLPKPEFQDDNHPNICWSIALSNLLACQGIQIPSNLIRTARVENAAFELNKDYISRSPIHMQSGRGELSSVRQGFNQIAHLDIVKNYHCEESNYTDALLSNPKLKWKTWFVSKLQEAFGGKDFNKNHSSAMTFTNDKHVITILGFNEINFSNPGKTMLYVYDSLNPNKKPVYISLQQLEQIYIIEKNASYENTGICYLEKNK